MKKVYIPAGETVCYDELHTNILIVKGKLKVQGKLTAKSIQGKGVIEACEIICDTADVDTATANIFTAQKIAAKKLFITECRAAVIAVTDFIEARTVCAGKLTMSLSSISICKADEIIVLPQKKRGLLGMLWASWWRSLWMAKSSPAKPAHQTQKASAKDRAEAKKRQPPIISDRTISVLATELEKRGFVRNEVSPPQFTALEEDSAA